MLCLRQSDRQMTGLMSLLAKGPEALGKLMETDEGLAGMFGPDGLGAVMNDFSLIDNYSPAAQKGIKLLLGAMGNPNLVYNGTPVRCKGRVIGTFCVTYSMEGELDEARKEILIAKANELSQIYSSVGDTDS